GDLLDGAIARPGLELPRVSADHRPYRSARACRGRGRIVDRPAMRLVGGCDTVRPGAVGARALELNYLLAIAVAQDEGGRRNAPAAPRSGGRPRIAHRAARGGARGSGDPRRLGPRPRAAPHRAQP